MSTTIFSASEPLTWKQADADVHVATRGGEFAGFVESDGDTHLVRDHLGADLGAHPTLESAFAALEAAHAPAQQPRRFPIALPRVLRRRPRRARA